MRGGNSMCKVTGRAFAAVVLGALALGGGVLGAAGEAAADPWKDSGIDWAALPALGADRPFAPPALQRAELKSGVKLVVVEKRGLPLVAMTVIVQGAGVAADPPGLSGLAGLVADLLDEGAGGLTGNDISSQVALAGGDLSTFVTTDAAMVRVTGLSARADRLLDVVGKLVREPTFAADDVERVRADRLVDLTLRRDEPGAVANLILAGGMFGRDTAYGRSSLGTPVELAAITGDNLVSFHRARFQPAAVTVVVVGDLTLAEAKEVVGRAFGDWAPTTGGAISSAPPPAVEPPAAARVLMVDRPGLAQTAVRIGLRVPQRADVRAYTVDVLANVLGGTFTSRLNRRLREELGYTYGIGARASFARRGSILFVSSNIVTESTPDALREIGLIFEDLVARPLSDAEMSKGRQNLIQGGAEQFMTVDRAAEAVGEVVSLGLPDDWFVTYPKRIAAVTAADVQREAKALLRKQRLVTVLIGDRAAIGAGLKKIGLPEPLLHDADGVPLAPPAAPPKPDKPATPPAPPAPKGKGK